jgi:hypothetical protein
VAPSSSPFGGFSPGRQDYQGYARAFTRNEIVNAAIRLLATSAAEPQIIGRRWRRAKPTYQSMPLNSVHVSNIFRKPATSTSPKFC